MYQLSAEEGEGDGNSADDDDAMEVPWVTVGGGRAQRRRQRRQQNQRRDANAVEAGNVGDVDDSATGRQQQQSRPHRQQEQGGISSCQPQATDIPTPFVAPPYPRRLCAARTAMLRAKISDLRERGADQQELQAAEHELRQSERVTKEAGGATASGLRFGILAQARKDQRKADAVSKQRKLVEDRRRECREAEQALADAESKLRSMEAEHAAGIERSAYLAMQAAVESRPAQEAQSARRAQGFLEGLRGSLPPEAGDHLDVLGGLVDLLYPSEEAARTIVAEVGLAVDSDDDLSGADDADGQPEVTAQLLDARREARQTHKGVARRRQTALAEAAANGEAVETVYKRFADEERRAASEVKDAEDNLRQARKQALERLASEERQRIAAAAATEAAAGAATATGSGNDEMEDDGAAPPGPRARSARQLDDDEERIPCPPAKWRRGSPNDDDSEDSNVTIDETPVIACSRHGNECADIREVLADGAVGVAAASINARSTSAEGRRQAAAADRLGRSVSSGVRWKAQHSGSQEAAGTSREDRSKSPRRLAHQAGADED